MSIIAIKTRSQQAANMAAARAPMVDPLAQMAALTAANAALQAQVANLQPGITAPTSAI
jgi:cell division protein FtsB